MRAYCSAVASIVRTDGGCSPKWVAAMPQSGSAAGTLSAPHDLHEIMSMKVCAVRSRRRVSATV